MRPRALRLVTFDLDDTLWDVRPVLAHAEEITFCWIRERCPALADRFDRAALVELRVRLLRQRPELRNHISELRREAMRTGLLECGYTPDEAQALATEGFEVFHAARHRVEPFAAVEACLRELGADYVLGVLTNGNADVFRLPLGRHFRFAIRAESIGASKPDAAHFRAALDAAGVAPSQALHVGDHPEHDIAGALGAGMHAAWFNPLAHTWPGQGPAPGIQFGDFSELPSLLRGLGQDATTG